jgi:hypothetical protein
MSFKEHHQRLFNRSPGREVAVELWCQWEAGVCKDAQCGDKRRARQGGECGIQCQQDRFKPQVNSLTKMSEVGVEAKAEMTRPSNTKHSGKSGFHFVGWNHRA